MPNLCGVNQKILSDLLEAVRVAGVSKKSQPQQQQRSQQQVQTDVCGFFVS
jgi:hypothetical protein